MAMLADAYVLPGMGRDVDKLKKHVRHIKAAVKAGDAALVESFAAMSYEINQMWSAVQLAHAGASATPVSPTASTQSSQDLGIVIEHLLKDLPFQKGAVRLVLADLDKAKFDTMANVEQRLLNVSAHG